MYMSIPSDTSLPPPTSGRFWSIRSSALCQRHGNPRSVPESSGVSVARPVAERREELIAEQRADSSETLLIVGGVGSSFYARFKRELC